MMRRFSADGFREPRSPDLFHFAVRNTMATATPHKISRDMIFLAYSSLLSFLAALFTSRLARIIISFRCLMMRALRVLLLLSALHKRMPLFSRRRVSHYQGRKYF